MVEIDRYGDFIYEPPAGMSGEDVIDKFPYTLYDGSQQSNTAWVHITLSDDVDGYMANDDHYPAPADRTLTVGNTVGLFMNDDIIPGVNNVGAEMSVPERVKIKGVTRSGAAPVQIKSELGGEVTITQNGAFTYEPPAEAPGEEYVDTFTYAFTDWDVAEDVPGDKESNEGTVYLHVGMDALTVSPDVMYSTTMNTPLTVQEPGALMFAKALKVSGSTVVNIDNLTDSRYGMIQDITFGDPNQGGTIEDVTDEEGEVVGEPGSFMYTPAQDFTGFEEVSYDWSFEEAGTGTNLASGSTEDQEMSGKLILYVQELSQLKLTSDKESINARVEGIDTADTNTANITAQLYGDSGMTFPWLGIEETIAFTTTPVMQGMTIAPTATTSMDTGTAVVSLTAGFQATPSISVTGKTAWGLEDSVALMIDEPAYDLTLSGPAEVAVGEAYTATATVEPQVQGMSVQFSYSDGIVSSQEIMSDTTAIEDGHIFTAEGTAYISATLRSFNGSLVKTSNTISVTVLAGEKPSDIDLVASTEQADITVMEDGTKEAATVELTATLKDALGNDFVFTGSGAEPDIIWDKTGGTFAPEPSLAAIQETGMLMAEMARDVEVYATVDGQVNGEEQTITDTVTISFRYVDEEGNPLAAGEDFVVSEEIDPTSETSQTLNLNDIVPGVDLEASIPSDFLLGFGNVYVEIIPITIEISGTVVIVAFDVNVYSEDGELLNDQITAFDKAITVTFYIDPTVATVSFSNGMLAVWTKQEPKNDINNWEDKGRVSAGAAVSLSQTGDSVTVDVGQPGKHIVYDSGLGPVYLPRITK